MIPLIAFPKVDDVTFERDGVPYVAMRRVCEAMGLNWAGQQQKLRESEVFVCMDIHTHDTTGRVQSMLAMPVSDFPLWLASINPAKIKDEDRRSKIILYQRESAIALHRYWSEGVAIRGDMDGASAAMAVQRNPGAVTDPARSMCPRCLRAGFEATTRTSH